MAQRHLKDTPGWLTPLVTPSVPDLPQLESKTVIERAQRKNKDEPRKVAIGPPSTFPKEYRMGQRHLEEVAGVDSPPTATTTKKPALNPTPVKPQNPTHEPPPDIHLQTPKGEHVQELEAQWEPNPYALACGDTSGLWGIRPGHYHLWASTTATTLYNLAQSDLRSQFYKTCPKREPNPRLEPSWSLGKDKVINNQKRFASRRQAPEAREYARNVVTRPTATASSSTLSQNQERPRAIDDIHQEDSALEPTYEEIAAPLKDNDLFYKNGNPKPPSTGRLPNRGLTSRERKRPGGRKKDGRRDRRRGSNVEVPKGFNPETPKKTNKGDKPTQLSTLLATEAPNSQLSLKPRSQRSRARRSGRPALNRTRPSLCKTL